jgi:integrase
MRQIFTLLMTKFYAGSVGHFCPTPVRGSVKYGQHGGCAAELFQDLNLPKETALSLAALGNLGVSKATWSTYKTAKAMLAKCETETQSDLSLPFNERKTLIFVDWLTRVRKLKGATVNSYLAGIRQLHIISNFDAPVIRTGLVKLVLKGINNRDGIQKRSEKPANRLPMTVNTMLIFKNTISSSHLCSNDKRLIWAVATLAFAGGFRIGELLSKHEATYDPDFTLLAKDVSTSSDKQGRTTIHVYLKCPKETKSAAPTVVDVFQSGGSVCPVKAFLTWSKLRPRIRNEPLFRLDNGTPLTGTRMNRLIDQLLNPYVDKGVGRFNAHSFRTGLASMLANAGLPADELQAIGRWSSRAFEVYLKLKRTKRIATAKKVTELIH